MTIDELPAIRWRRKIRGISAVLLPYQATGQIDWDAFSAHVRRTSDAGLTPAVNLDAGYVALLDEATCLDVLRRTGDCLGGNDFVAGTYVADRPGDAFQLKAYLRRIEAVGETGGLPIILQSYGLAHQDSEHIVNDYEAIAACCDRFLVLEADEQIDPSGRIYRIGVHEALMEIPECVGAIYASFRRKPLWKRLKLRDRVRPDFLFLSGNDLALDMVTYGGDYLSAVSTFAPDWFALRDRLWEQGDPRVFELNDLLQFLAYFSLREPLPACRHSAAQFLHLRGWIESDHTHPKSPRRPESDVDVLREILIWIETFVDEIGDAGQ